MASLSTGINEPPPTYFPPQELSIATEVEQLLPSLGPELSPWEPCTLEVSHMDDELLLKSMPDVNNVPATDTGHRARKCTK